MMIWGLTLSCSDSQLRADSSSITASDLLWVRDCSSEPIVYPDLTDGPFIVLMESTVSGRNLGRYDPLTIADQIDEVIQAGRTIHRNGLNQIKIVCSSRADANLLITSHDLRILGNETADYIARSAARLPGVVPSSLALL